MLSTKKIKAQAVRYAVVFVVVSFILPMTLYAGPPIKCPCFTEREVNRWIDKSDSPVCDSKSEWDKDGSVLLYELTGKGNQFYAVAFDEVIEGVGFCQHTYTSYTPKYRVVEEREVGLTTEEVQECIDILVPICAQ